MGSISGDRIWLLCHTVNRVANEMYGACYQEFHWAVEIALTNSDLPESWIVAATTRKMTAEYFKSFRANGYCLRSDDLGEILRGILG